MNLDDHLAKVRHNWAFLTRLDQLPSSDSFDDWRVVAVFYSALHLIDAFLHENGADHGRSHGERNMALRELADKNVLSLERASDYFRLASRARALRYTDVLAGSEDFRRLVSSQFRPLQTEVLGKISLQLELVPLSFEP